MNNLNQWDRTIAGAYLQRKPGGRDPNPARAARIAKRYGANLSRAYAWAKGETVAKSRRDFWEWLQRERVGAR